VRRSNNLSVISQELRSSKKGINNGNTSFFQSSIKVTNGAEDMDSLTRSYGREKDSLERVNEYLPENPMIDPSRTRKKKSPRVIMNQNSSSKKQGSSIYRQKDIIGNPEQSPYFQNNLAFVTDRINKQRANNGRQQQ